MSKKRAIMAGKALNVKEFKLSSFQPNPAICMLAKRGSGKSWVVRSILRNFGYYPGGLIISKTEQSTMFYGKFIRDIYIHYEYSNEVLQKFLERQKIMVMKARKKIEQGKKLDPRAWIVMDDCMSGAKNWVKQEPIQDIFFNSRHTMTSFCLTLQYPLGIPPDLRANFDYVFLLADDSIINQKKMYEYYAGIFPNLNAFQQVFNELTKDYGCMVLINRGSRANFTDKIRWYKAKVDDADGDYIGCKQYHKFHKLNYDPDHMLKKRSFDISSLAKNKNKSSINVLKV